MNCRYFTGKLDACFPVMNDKVCLDLEIENTVCARTEWEYYYSVADQRGAEPPPRPVK